MGQIAPIALSKPELGLLDSERRAVLATSGPDGRPRLVPICYAVRQHPVRLFVPLDRKPKSVADPRRLARVRDILERPEVTVLVDHWDEDWRRLAWLRLTGLASLLEPEAGEEHWQAVAGLLGRYAQYADHGLEERPVIRILVTAIKSWRGDSG